MPSLRYVVLRHEGIADPHFDLMFETAPGSAPRTWRSSVWPITERTQLVELRDHRRAYLEYEGPVSDNRGQVRCICSGFFKIVAMNDVEWRLVLDDFESELLMSKSSGEWVATPAAPSSGGKSRR